MMHSEFKLWPALVYALAVTVIFAWLRYFFDPNALTIILNGVFAGSIVAFGAALWPLFRDIVRGRTEGIDVGWFTIGLFVAVISMIVSTITSTVARASNTVVLEYVTTLSPMARYLAIVGLLTMIYAPDAGKSFFYGRDRKIVAASVIVGVISAAFVIYLQAYRVLA